MLDTISSILREDARYGIEHEEMLDTISSILREDAWYGIEHTQMLGHCIETYDGCVFKKKDHLQDSGLQTPQYRHGSIPMDSFSRHALCSLPCGHNLNSSVVDKQYLAVGLNWDGQGYQAGWRGERGAKSTRRAQTSVVQESRGREQRGKQMSQRDVRKKMKP